MAKFNEAAEKYAKPHTMSGKDVTVENAIPVKSGAELLKELNVSSGPIGKGNYKPTKTDGITMRGHGAATKGIKSRGPMA
jgi:hypothetical protein